jgi:Tfp pilus assembly protein PilF
VGGEVFVTTSQLGPNLYIGNHEAADGTYESLKPFRGKAAFERQDATDLAEQALGRPLTPGEVSAYYTGEVLEFIRSHPGAWLRLLARKFVLVWNATEISDTEDQYTYAEWSWPVAAGTIWNLGALAPLAILGFFVAAPGWRKTWLLHALLATYIAGIVLFYVFARYRFPIVPFLVLLAAMGLAGAREFFHRASRARIAGCVGAIIAVAVFCNLPLVARDRLRATTHFNFGTGLEAKGLDEDAIREYRLATRLDSGLAVAHGNLGLLLAKQGRLSDAAVELEDTVQLWPDYAKGFNNLGVVLARMGRLADAQAPLESAVRFDPNYAEAQRNLASVRSRLADLYAQSGELDAAAAELRRVIEASPDRSDAHNNLGIVLARQGDLKGAASEFERALALNPSDAQTRRNLERVRTR